jgi:hypothetical protein
MKRHPSLAKAGHEKSLTCCNIRIKYVEFSNLTNDSYTASIVTRLFAKDESFTLFKVTCGPTKSKFFNIENKATRRDFKT